MKYLKTFEGRFRGLDKQQIEDNIEGRLVSLYDDDESLNLSIVWLGGNLPNPPGLEIHIKSSRGRFITDSTRKNISLIKESVLTIVDYLEMQWGKVKVKYDSSYLGFDFDTVTDLDELKKIGAQTLSELVITIEKLNVTPKRLNERLGISQDMEQQVEEYMKEIEKKPISKVFKFVYKCDLGSYFFKLVIDPSIDSEGYFTGSNIFIGDLEIHLKDREDESTLLHEVKHLDYYLRKNGKTKTIYDRMERSVSNSDKTKVSQRTLGLLEHIFYIYDENEFQSKYTSFYKSFDLFLSKQNKDFTKSEITELFLDSKQWTKDSVFSWYMVGWGQKVDYNFTFDKFIDKDELRVVFNYIISEHSRRTFKNPYLDFLSYLVADIKKNIKIKFKLFTDKEKVEIEKAIRFFEKDINKRIQNYKRRMSRIVTLACEKYVK